MMNIKPLHVSALALLIPLAAAAQLAPGTADLRAAATLLNRADVLASKGGLKKLSDLRLASRRKLGFTDGAACTAPTPISTADVDIHRTLFVHDSATLSAGNFSLRRTLQKLSDDVAASVPGTTPETIFRQMMDSQNTAAGGVTPAGGNPHCDDNEGKVNGFPFNQCPRAEGGEALGLATDVTNRIDNDYKPIGLVNRIDLADKGWKNCGEHRIVYGKNSGSGKNLIIFEAVLPNPKPGCRSGCRDIIDFWVDLSSETSPTARAAELEKFFYKGLAGFQPVVKTTHYTSGTSSVYGGSSSGQIRTNQFLTKAGVPQIWTLKEFKTLVSCSGGTCDYDLLPVSVKVNPYGLMWSKDIATGTVPPNPPGNPSATPIANLATLATNFQTEVIAQVTIDRLANPDVNTFTYEVQLDKNSAESQSQRPTIDHYPNQFANSTNAGFKTDLNTAAAVHGLTGAQIVNRATAQSCAGCHLPPGFGLTAPNSIGPGMSWPNALTFVHVDTPPMVSLEAQPGFDSANFDNNAQGFNISPALLDTFLPARSEHLVELANDDVCDCVPKPEVLPGDRAKLPRQRAIIDRLTRGTRAEILQAEKRFVDRTVARPDDAKTLLDEKKAILAKLEATRERELAAEGLQTKPLDLKPEPIVLSATRLSPDRLRKAKLDKMNELVRSEPPRETITGSFRSH